MGSMHQSLSQVQQNGARKSSSLRSHSLTCIEDFGHDMSSFKGSPTGPGPGLAG